MSYSRKEYAKWRKQTFNIFKRRGLRIQRKSIHKLQTRINNAVRGLNSRKNNVLIWTFKDVSLLVIKTLGYPCLYCEKQLHWKRWSLDHKKPVERGGTNAKINIQIICTQCNRRKGTLSHKHFMKLVLFLKQYPRMFKDIMQRLAYGGKFYSS